MRQRNSCAIIQIQKELSEGVFMKVDKIKEELINHGWKYTEDYDECGMVHCFRKDKYGGEGAESYHCHFISVMWRM